MKTALSHQLEIDDTSRMRNVVAAVVAASLLVAPRAHAEPPGAQAVTMYPVRVNDALYDGGIGMMGVGSVALFVGVVGWLGSTNKDGSQCLGLCGDHSAIAFGSVALLGLTSMLVGSPLAIVGGRRVSRVTASVGPTGGALRVTF